MAAGVDTAVDAEATAFTEATRTMVGSVDAADTEAGAAPADADVVATVAATEEDAAEAVAMAPAEEDPGETTATMAEFEAVAPGQAQSTDK